MQSVLLTIVTIIGSFCLASVAYVIGYREGREAVLQTINWTLERSEGVLKQPLKDNKSQKSSQQIKVFNGTKFFQEGHKQ